MLPLSDGIPARRFPIVNVLLIVANSPCSSSTSCRSSTRRSTTPRSTRAASTAPAGHRGRGASAGSPPCSCTAAGITSWATCCSWRSSERTSRTPSGQLAYLVFYFAGGFAAMMTQTAMTLLFGAAQDARVPELGASGAIAAVLGAYFVLYPGSRIRTYIFPIFLVRIPAWIFLGLWFFTSSSRRASGYSAPRRTGAAWRSSPTSAGSSSACWQHGSWPGRDRQHPGSNGAPRRSPAGSSPRRNRRSQTPVAEMRVGAGSGIVSLVIKYQQ